MYVIISYDIPDDNRRTKIAKIILDYAERVQYSVYEAEINNDLLSVLKKRIAKIIKKKDDSVRFYILCHSCLQKVFIMGQGKIVQGKDVYIL
ncbi:CRISPR-associated endonuclease Cas2 [candidate division KSB1 bacterium]|nr:CRISPR-associated endonuclease Cas2 [candidate division KSB1 bacterium]